MPKPVYIPEPQVSDDDDPLLEILEDAIKNQNMIVAITAGGYTPRFSPMDFSGEDDGILLLNGVAQETIADVIYDTFLVLRVVDITAVIVYKPQP